MNTDNKELINAAGKQKLIFNKDPNTNERTPTRYKKISSPKPIIVSTNTVLSMVN